MNGTELPELARSILLALLDRAEQPGRRQMARVRLSEREHLAYFSAEDAAPRRAANSAFAQLARDGVLSLRWRRWEEGNWLEAVDLRPAGMGALYRLLGCAPRATQEEALRALLAAQRPLSGWHAAFLAWAAAQLEAGRSQSPLDRNNLEVSGLSPQIARVVG